MAERTYREIRLTGLGTSIEDRVADLKDLRAVVASREEAEEIDRLVQQLERTRQTCAAFCRAWSRAFEIED
jgi:hypothetical protein